MLPNKLLDTYSRDLKTIELSKSLQKESFSRWTMWKLESNNTPIYILLKRK